MEIDLAGIQRELSHLKCIEHGKNAELNINGQAIQSKTCCEKFAKEVNETYGTLLAEDMKQATIRTLSGL